MELWFILSLTHLFNVILPTYDLNLSVLLWEALWGNEEVEYLERTSLDGWKRHLPDGKANWVENIGRENKDFLFQKWKKVIRYMCDCSERTELLCTTLRWPVSAGKVEAWRTLKKNAFIYLAELGLNCSMQEQLIAPQPRIVARSPALGAWSLNRSTTREIYMNSLMKSIKVMIQNTVI